MATDTRLTFFTVEKLGPKQELTPEGFLLCRDVAIARTGEMLYGPEETPIEPGPDGLVHISRSPEEVFRPETIASFNGKPVVNDHPSSGVVPENWNELAVGTTMNPRREGDLLIADLLITNPEAIEAVRSGKREVSCGYDVDYVQTGLGRGKQVNIIGNHVALVEEGRCGKRCAIKDHAHKGAGMKTWDEVWKGIKDKIRKAAKDNNPVALEAALDSIKVTKDDGEQVHVHFPEEQRDGYTKDEVNALFAEHEKKHEAIDSRLGAHDSALAEVKEKQEQMGKDMAPLLPASVTGDEMPDEELENEAPAGTGDKARTATDSVYMADSFAQTVAMAEVIAPGIKLPTFDQAAKAKDTFKQVCNLRRDALTRGQGDEATSAIILEANGGKALDAAGIKSLDCSAVRSLFFGVGAAKKRLNNASGAVDTSHGSVVPQLTIAELNKKHRAKYAGK